MRRTEIVILLSAIATLGCSGAPPEHVSELRFKPPINRPPPQSGTLAVGAGAVTYYDWTEIKVTYQPPMGGSLADFEGASVDYSINGAHVDHSTGFADGTAIATQGNYGIDPGTYPVTVIATLTSGFEAVGTGTITIQSSPTVILVECDSAVEMSHTFPAEIGQPVVLSARVLGGLHETALANVPVNVSWNGSVGPTLHTDANGYVGLAFTPELRDTPSMSPFDVHFTFDGTRDYQSADGLIQGLRCLPPSKMELLCLEYNNALHSCVQYGDAVCGG